MTDQVHILTDSTAQFLEPKFKGRQLVTTLPLEPNITPTHQGALRPGCVNTGNGGPHPPTAADFEHGYLSLSRVTRDVLVLTTAQAVSRAYDGAGRAAAKLNGALNIRVVDSFTLAGGLGWLVQAAARLAQDGMHLSELERCIRLAAAHIYTLLCIPDLTFLASTGYLTAEQARVGEMLGMIPIFSIEEGRLTPLSKVRNSRHLLETFQEFVGEFESPRHVIYLKAANTNHQIRFRALRDFMGGSFPDANLTEMPVSPHLAACIGPQSSGIIVVERSEKFV